MASSKLIFKADERGARAGEKAEAPIKEAMMARARNIFKEVVGETDVLNCA